MELINELQLIKLKEDAIKSSRARSHLQLHKSHKDPVQRVLIYLCKGSYVEPHYHSGDNQWEMFVVLKGQIELVKYNVDGTTKQIIELDSSKMDFIVQIMPNEIHSLLCVSKDALLLEIKEGPFDEKNAKVFPSF